jgi:hypothetical protein
LDAWQNAQLLRFGGALHQADPLVALMDAWAVNAALANYLDRNSAPDELPLSLRDVALDMLKRREARLAHIASRYLPPDSIAALSSRIDAFAAGHAIPKTEILQTDSGSWTSPLFSVWAKGQAAVGSLLQLPLMPGRALGGMAKTGEAMTGIRESTAQAVQIAGELPERMRVAFQSALTNLVAQRAEIMEILGAMDAVSTNLRATAEAAHVTAAEARKSMVLARE